MTNVEVAGVRKTYGRVPILHGVSIRFESGKLTSLLGPSGSGKTTLLRIVAGFVSPDSGSVTIAGEEVSRDPVWKRDIGMVFQSYALFPHMTIAQNVAFGLNRRGIRGGQARKQVEQALEMVRMSGFASRMPSQLSGGQQQRVALARAIVIRPKVLLLDEPLSALDRRLRQEMQVELKRIQREVGLTTIFVTHDQEEALTLSDRIAILDKGWIVQEDIPAAIYERPRTRFAAGFLGDANFFTGDACGEGIRIDGAVIRAMAPIQGRVGEATIVVRPEKMSIAARDMLSGTDNRLDATIEEAVYAGATTTYLLAGPGGRALRVFTQNRDASAYAKGEAVTIGWSACDSVMLED